MASAKWHGHPRKHPIGAGQEEVRDGIHVVAYARRNHGRRAEMRVCDWQALVPPWVMMNNMLFVDCPACIAWLNSGSGLRPGSGIL